MLSIVRKKLTPDEIQPPTTRYNSDCDCVQVTGDGGLTWTDAVGLDPRSQPAYLRPPLTTDNPRCDAAANMVAAIRHAVDTMEDGSTVWAVASLLLALFGAFLPLGLISALVVIVADAIWTIGIALLRAAMTEEVYAQLLCIFLDNEDADGRLTPEGYAALYPAVEAQIEATAAGFLERIFDLMGYVGLSNAGSSGVETGDCTECDTHCFTIDFELTDGSEYGVSKLFAGGEWVDGVGWATTLDGVDQDVTLGLPFPETLSVVAMSAITYRPAASGFDSGVNLNLKYPGTAYADPTVQHADNLDNTDLPPFTFQTGATFANTLGDGITVDNNSGNSEDVVVTKRVSVRYTGDIPAGWSDNC